MSSYDSHQPSLVDLGRIWSGTLSPLSNEEQARLVFPRKRNDNLRENTFWLQYDTDIGGEKKRLVVARGCVKCNTLRKACDRGIPSCSRCAKLRIQCQRDTSQPEVMSVGKSSDGLMMITFERNRNVRSMSSRAPKKITSEDVEPSELRRSSECLPRIRK